MSTDDGTDTRTVEQIRTDIDRTRAELGGDVTALTDQADPRSRMRQLVTTAKTKATSAASQGRAAAAPKVRQAGQKVGDHRLPAAAGALVVAGAATVLVLQRRRAAKARATRSRWLPGFLNR
jgi:uncharacterized protein DUF3618